VQRRCGWDEWVGRCGDEMGGSGVGWGALVQRMGGLSCG
jgi:hypothetical protein